MTDFVERPYFDDKLNNLNRKITSNETKHVLVQNELNKVSKKLKQ